MHVELVAHCWRYWRCLTYHLSSLYLDPPKDGHVTLKVFYTQEDHGTNERIQQFEKLTWPDNVTLNPQSLPSERLFRRSIGRNLAALETNADLVWFTDCDFVISGQAVDELCRLSHSHDLPLMYPCIIHQSTKARGEELIQEATKWTGPLRLDTNGFGSHRIRRAIGAVQIVRGDVCREVGYLKDHRKAQSSARTWKRCIEDVKFRKSLGAGSQPLGINQIFRLRHREAGRHRTDIDL